MGSVNMYSGNSGSGKTWVYGSSSLVNLKCWHKAEIDSSNNPMIKLDAKDVLDLNAWKYSNEVPILDHTLSATLADPEMEVEGDGYEDEDEDENDIKPRFAL